MISQIEMKEALMPDEVKVKTMAEIPMQKAQNPSSPAEARGCFFNSANAFNLILPSVPDAVFTDEPAAALAEDAPTGYITCDLSREMGNVTPATSPLLLARYARINRGDSLASNFNANGSIWYVIQGSGTASLANENIKWSTGDVFVLPGTSATLESQTDKSVLWVVTNEPHLEFENTLATHGDETAVDVSYFSTNEIDRQIDMLYEVDKPEDTAGIALIFSSEKQSDRRNITPTMTLAMNTLPPGDFQRAHRHNSVALTLVVQGNKCYSMIDGHHKDWSPWATTVTPPESLHAHFNDGNEMARFLIVQDGGFYYHARTMGFSFD